MDPAPSSTAARTHSLSEYEIKTSQLFCAANYAASAVLLLQHPFVLLPAIYNLFYFLRQLVLIKSDWDYFHVGDTANGTGEGILFVIALGVTLAWEHVAFSRTATHDARVRSMLSMIGIAICTLSFSGYTPAVAQAMGPHFGERGFAFGAFVFSFAKFWSIYGEEEDGTLKYSAVSACQGAAFLVAGLSSLLLESMPTVAGSLVFVTDVSYAAGAILYIFIAIM